VCCCGTDGGLSAVVIVCIQQARDWRGLSAMIAEPRGAHDDATPQTTLSPTAPPPPKPPHSMLFNVLFLIEKPKKNSYFPWDKSLFAYLLTQTNRKEEACALETMTFELVFT